MGYKLIDPEAPEREMTITIEDGKVLEIREVETCLTKDIN